MWLFQYFIKDITKGTLTRGVCAMENYNPREQENLTTYCRVVKFLIATYTIDHTIFKAKAESTNLSSRNVCLHQAFGGFVGNGVTL